MLEEKKKNNTEWIIQTILALMEFTFYSVEKKINKYS